MYNMTGYTGIATLSEKFAEGSLTIPCTDITISKDLPEKICIVGPGDIFLASNEGLTYRLYSSSIEDFRKLHDSNNSRTAGCKIHNTELFSLVAHDIFGNEWTGKYLLPPSSESGNNGGIITGSIRELESQSETSMALRNDLCRIRVSGHYDLPANELVERSEACRESQRIKKSTGWEGAFYSVANEEIRAYYGNSHTIIDSLLLNGQQRTHSYWRIIEAFQFILGRIITPSSIEHHFDNQIKVQLFSFTHSQSGINFPPPMQLPRMDHEGNFAQLFYSYYSSIRDYDQDRIHPVSAWIKGVIAAWPLYIETAVLELCVAIEGIAGYCLSHYGTVGDGQCDDVDQITSAISQLNIDNTLKKRAIGAIGSLKNIRNSDRLREFCQQRDLMHLYSIWKSFRHPSAHGNSSTVNWEEVGHLRYSLVMLLYSIIYTYIGHNGKVTDYSRIGWTSIDWPSAT